MINPPAGEDVPELESLELENTLMEQQSVENILNQIHRIQAERLDR